MSFEIIFSKACHAHKNTIEIVSIKTLEQAITVSTYLPLVNTKNFYNFKQRVLLQVSLPLEVQLQEKEALRSLLLFIFTITL